MARRKKGPEKDLTFEVLRVALFEKCKALGATAIICDYSGSGDSGQIDDVRFDTSNNDIPSEPKATWFQDHGMHYDEKLNRFVPTEAGTVELPLKEAVEAYCYSVIEKNHPGDWVNDEGGGGELVVSLTLPPKVTLKCYDNISVTHNWEVDCETGVMVDKGRSE